MRCRLGSAYNGGRGIVNEGLPMNYEPYDELVRRRRSVRHFKADALPDGLVERLVATAQWAPSGYNIQPAHFVVVTEEAVKRALCAACMGQKQILEAPATVVFTGDRRAAWAHLDRMIAQEYAAGSMSEGYEKTLRTYVPLAFGTGPAGWGWLWKATLGPVMRWFSPVPSLPAVHRSYWLAKQVSLCAMTFMLAATAAGLGTCPMEGYDDRRVRKALGMTGRYQVVLVVPVGYAADPPGSRTRLPLEQVMHRDRF